MDLDDLISDMIDDKVHSMAKKKTEVSRKKKLDESDDLFDWGPSDPKMTKNSKSEMPTKIKKDDDDAGWGQGQTFGAKKQTTVAKKEEDEWGVPTRRSEDAGWGAPAV